MRKKRGRYGMRWILRQGEENQESEKEERSEREIEDYWRDWSPFPVAVVD